MVEFSPATREARVQFPANASTFLFLFIPSFQNCGELKRFFLKSQKVESKETQFKLEPKE